ALRERIPKSGWASLLVKPETVLGWHRALVRRKWAAYSRRPRRGRPPISAESRRLILRMARENPGWGYFRIRGELLKVGHRVAATTIRSVLLATGVPPAGRRSQLTWKQFLAAHCRDPGCCRLLQRGCDLLQAALHPYICASGLTPSLDGELHLGLKCCLGLPASPQSQREARGRRD